MSGSEKIKKKGWGPTLFDPRSTESFQLSRYHIERFVDCARCFWLELRRGLKKPETHPYTLNVAVDTLVKREFDHYRKLQKQHPLMERFKIRGVPFDHPNLPNWRLTTKGKGMRFLHPDTNFDITGSPDDIWLITDGTPRLSIVDTKATSSKETRPIEHDWWKSYRRQLDIYTWLLERQQTDYPTSRTGYFMLLNGNAASPEFNLTLKFVPNIIVYETNTGWIEDAIYRAHTCLVSDTAPLPSDTCDFCSYRRKASELE